MMFQSTFSSGQVRLEEGEVGGDLVETILHAPTPFMARPNQPLLLRKIFCFISSKRLENKPRTSEVLNFPIEIFKNIEARNF